MTSLIPTLMIVWSPSTSLASLYCKDISVIQLKQLKNKVGEVIKETEHASWEQTETTIFPEGWVPKEMVWFVEDESNLDEFFTSHSDDSEGGEIEEKEAGSEESSDEEEDEEESDEDQSVSEVEEGSDESSSDEEDDSKNDSNNSDDSEDS